MLPLGVGRVLAQGCAVGSPLGNGGIAVVVDPHQGRGSVCGEVEAGPVVRAGEQQVAGLGGVAGEGGVGEPSLLPQLRDLAAALASGGAVLKEPRVRDRGFRFALYGGCGLRFAVEVVRILVCWKPAAAYAATVSTAESVMISRYADLSAVAWPLETVRWIVLAAVVAAWLVWGMQAYRHAKKN